MVLGVAGSSVEARADETEPVAEALFQRGKELVAEGNIAAACPKFEESQRLNPGSGTLLNLALCHERLGLLARAWAEYSAVPSLARHDARPDREEFAREHAEELEPRLPRLKVAVRPGADAPGLVLKLDGEPLGRPAWGTSIPLDPGQHSVEAIAPGRTAWAQSVKLTASGGVKTVIVGPLHETAPGSGGQGGFQALLTRRNVGYAVGGAGIVLAGVGAIFGGLAIDANNQASQECGGQTTCPTTTSGPADSSRAMTDATIADITIGLGIVAVGVGVYLVLTSPRGAGSVASANGDPRRGPFVMPIANRGGGGSMLAWTW